MDAKVLQNIKNRYDIIGNDVALNRAIDIAFSVAPTDLTILITGESGVGKENIPKIIHQNSLRKTGKYFAVNCGAIPEGTIDSELFGHEKGAFTGASEMRKGYFEEANGGTLFLDEIGELPMASQAKLLRVLQSGEFIRVGSSKVMKTDVRVVTETNLNLQHAVEKGKFREDLFYRLNAINIKMPSLRDRGQDIYLLFRKFASDFSEKYNLDMISLSVGAIDYLCAYRWPGNIRQLKNITESISILESRRSSPLSKHYDITEEILEKYIPKDESNLLPVKSERADGTINLTEKEAIIRTIYQLRQEVEFLKKEVSNLTKDEKDSFGWQGNTDSNELELPEEQEVIDLSIQKAGEDLLKKALEKHNGNRKFAAQELGISERTLYRKIKNLEEE